MKTLCALLLAVCLFSPALLAQPASTCEIHDATESFWKFWSAAEGKPREQQVKLAREMVVRANPELYAPEVLRLPPDFTLDQALDRGLERMTPHVQDMRAATEFVRTRLSAVAARFQQAFPDFRCSSPVYVMVSFGAFDGAGRKVQGKHALLFGIDVIARVHRTEDLEAFFQHELFHMYQPQVAKEPTPSPLYVGLWSEGMASYVAHVLNPQVPEPAILGRPVDLAERLRPQLHALAAEVLGKLSSTSNADSRRFFMGDPSGKNTGEFPPRSGYYLGYLLAHDIGQRYTLREMARLQGEPLRKELEAALRALMARTPPGAR